MLDLGFSFWKRTDANARQKIFARGEDGDSLKLLNTYASVLQSYCNDDDPFCASGTDESVHSAEVDSFEQAATDFIVGRNS